MPNLVAISISYKYQMSFLNLSDFNMKQLQFIIIHLSAGDKIPEDLLIGFCKILYCVISIVNCT